MNNKKIVGFLLLIITPFIAYYFLILGVQEVFSIFKIKDLVGVVAILSGVTGIVTGFSSSRQASLDAVKNYFQQGDEDAFSNARKRILDAKETDDIDSSDVSKICNFFGCLIVHLGFKL
jgi:hypothetical protein